MKFTCQICKGEDKNSYLTRDHQFYTCTPCRNDDEKDYLRKRGRYERVW